MSNSTPLSIIKEIKGNHPTVSRVLFVGCGASMADLYPAFYFISHECPKIVTGIMTANEFNYDPPKDIDENTIVITASLGGTTPESVEATKKAVSMNAEVITLSHVQDSAIVKASKYSIVHGFEKNYAAKVEKMINALGLAIEIGHQYADYPYYDEAEKAIDGIGDLIEQEIKLVGPAAKEFGEKYKDDKTIYVMSSGATYGAAYATASFLLMEMQWISAPTLNTGEYFHGPFELTETNVPYLLFMNDGPTRPMDARALTFLQRFDARITTIDAKDHGLASVAGSHVIDYFNPILLTGVMRVYAEELAIARQHPLTKRRYMWKLEY